jgi:hypothetical protein
MTEKQPSGWAIGWTAFAGLLMIMMGFWWIISGSVALLDSTFYAVTQRWILQFDVSTWGWIHLILGIVILASGCGLFLGAVWARIVGVILAVLAGLLAFGWLPYYPVWAILFIAISVAVIWAPTVHGRDMAKAVEW